jgi:hypothetical protein
MSPREFWFRPGALAAVLALGAVWVVMHPFRGLHHDGVLYAAQALLHLEPERLAGDVFFAFGSQDDYTLFGRLYAAAIAAFGLVWGPRVLYALAHVLAFMTTLAWLASVLPARARMLGAAIVIAAPAVYGSAALFRVNEPFVTARLFAEPFVLLALLVLLRGGRPIITGVLLACAGLLHPLVALPGVLACGGLALFHSALRLRRIWLALSTVIGILLAASVVGEFWPRVGERWHSLLTEFGAIALPSTWVTADWVRQLFPALALALLAQREAPAWRLFCRVIAAVALGGTLLASFAEITRWELGLQAQFWRFAWLAAWALPIVAVRLAFGVAAHALAARGLSLAVVPALALSSQPWWPAAWVLPLASLVSLAVHQLARSPEGSTSRRLTAALLVVLIGFAGVGGTAALFVALTLDDPEQVRNVAIAPVLTDYLGWALCPLGVWLLLRISNLNRKSGIAVVAVTLLLALSFLADGRSMESRVLDRLIAEGAPWGADIPDDATVFWPGRMPYVWFGLRRNSYLSTSQVPGILFSEAKTVELARRFQEVGPVGGPERDDLWKGRDQRPDRPSPTHADLAQACADPILDYVVLDVALAPITGKPWIEPDTGRRFHLHRCADHRASVNPVLGPVAPPG